jgi:hypothetical protein
MVSNDTTAEEVLPLLLSDLPTTAWWSRASKKWKKPTQDWTNKHVAFEPDYQRCHMGGDKSLPKASPINSDEWMDVAGRLLNYQQSDKGGVLS